MLYLTQSEVAEYVTRQEVPAGEELKWAKAASILIDAWCLRPLSIKHYHKTVALNRERVGYLNTLPFIKFAPDVTVTGLRIRPRARTRRGGYRSNGSWSDFTIPAQIEEILDTRLGRLEIGGFDLSDYGRGLGVSPYYGYDLANISGFDAEVEFYAGFFVDTTVAESITANTTDTVKLNQTT